MEVVIKNVSDEREIKKCIKRVDSYCGMKHTKIALDIDTKLPVTAQIVLDKTAGEGCIVSESDDSIIIYIT